MSKYELTNEDKIELCRLCDSCKNQPKCLKKHNLHDHICFKKKLAINLAEVVFKKRVKKGEIK